MSLVICSMPGCDTTAGCKCRRITDPGTLDFLKAIEIWKARCFAAEAKLAALSHPGVMERAAAIEECAKVAEAQAQAFLSPEYASNQPFGSLCERFEEVAKAIRALAIPSADRRAP